MLSLMKYVSSFIDGRVRLRHPALRNANLVNEVRPVLSSVRGMRRVTFNVVTGSVLLEYDRNLLSRDELVSFAVPWAEYLDARAAGIQAEMPSVPM